MQFGNLPVKLYIIGNHQIKNKRTTKTFYVIQFFIFPQKKKTLKEKKTHTQKKQYILATHRNGCNEKKYKKKKKEKKKTYMKGRKIVGNGSTLEKKN